MSRRRGIGCGRDESGSGLQGMEHGGRLIILVDSLIRDRPVVKMRTSWR